MPPQRFFAAWIAQLANYALITVLTVMVAALLLQIVQSYAAQTAARGSGNRDGRRAAIWCWLRCWCFW